MKIGFTGTRRGMTLAQLRAIHKIVRRLAHDGKCEGHHGDCLGADTQFHQMCSATGIPVVIHPCNIRSQRAFCRDAVEVRKPMNPLDRNKIIVNEVDVMIAAPKEDREIIRSGTWMTYRQARRADRTIYLVMPDGMEG